MNAKCKSFVGLGSPRRFCSKQTCGLMEGYEVTLFCDKTKVENLQCAICLGIVRDVVETPWYALPRTCQSDVVLHCSGHLFCMKCIDSSLVHKKECPVDHN